MNKKELIDAMAAKTGASRAETNCAETNCAVGALIEIISDTLEKGDFLSLPGFGTFEVRDRA